MSTRRVAFYVTLAFLTVLVIGLPIRSQFTETQQTGTELISGRNVNMVSGTSLPDGDPWLQRQNEPSIAVSSRNPLHLLAGANDYRTVDIPASEGELPGKAQGAMAGDAWVGVYKSFDGGESWVTSLVYGFPQDQSSLGLASPLKQFSTAADPIVRAGTNGLFYYSGMAFNRLQTKGGGSIFLTRFIDNNNVEGSDPIKYLDTKIIDLGTSGQFIDMPRIGVDIPRGTGNVTIDGQSIPRSNIYCAYTVFLGNTSTNIRSRIMFRRSSDCGATWGSAIKISESQHIIQGATIAIDPNSGAVYVAFRRFLHPSQTNSIVFVKSNDFGQTFSQPVVIADINPFDQPVTDASGDGVSDPLGTSFRTNSYPTMTVDNTGIVYVAWTERGRGPGGAARIVMATSLGGSSWTTPAVVENPQEPGHMGHQFMPYLTFAAGKLTIVWYDQRNSVGANAYGWDNWIGDGMPIRQTVDIRAAQAGPGMTPVFEESIQVSRYYFILKAEGDAYTAEQAQFNPPNYPLFKGGTVPFHGDYVEMTPSPLFVLGPDGWRFNTDPSTTPAPPVFHVVWTDNRDVRPPDDANNYDWTNYTPPASDQGTYGSKTSCAPLTVGMRNQNIYTASLTRELVAAAPGNAKSLGDDLGYYNDDPAEGLIRRAFAIYVKNPTGLIKTITLEIISWPQSGGASFLEFQTLHELEVQIAPYSTIARTVFVWSTNDYDTAKVEVSEGGVSWGTVVLNPDPTNPAPGNGLGSTEIHNPNIVNPNIVNWDVANPNIVNPNIVNPNIVNYANPNIVNPNIVNPNIVNPNIVNPNIVNPNIVNPNIVNPNIVNPNIVNPNIVNPNIVNTNIEDAAITDVQCTVINEGNTVSAYTLKTFSKEAFPAGLYLQLLVYKVTATPSGGVDITGDDCSLKEERHHELLLNVSNPNIVNPNIVNPNIVNPNIVNGAIENASFSLEPGEEAEVTLRVIDLNPSQVQMLATGQVFSLQTFVDSLGFAATAHAVNTEDAKAGNYIPPAAASKLVIGTSALPDGVVGAPYTATLNAYGGTAPYSWALNSGELPPGLGIGSGGVINGTPTTLGLYHFIVRVDDTSGQFDTQQYSIYIDSDSNPDPLTITTTALPSGVLGYWYGATLEATGGVWPRTWSLAGGSLPLGLSLDSAGVISGTIQVESGQDYPTTYNFSVIVTDNAGTSTLPKALSIYVNIATGTYLTISGIVYDASSNPLNGVVMRGLPNTPITDANGYYEDTVPEFWSGTVEPFKATYSFTPASRTYSVVGSNQTSQDYNAGPVVGPASKLVFKQSPSGGVGGAIWTTQPIVEVQDAVGNIVTTDDSTVVTLAIENDPGNGSLSGPFSMTVTDGVASFAGLSLDKGGYSYTLKATSIPILDERISEEFGIEGFSDTANTMGNIRTLHTATTVGTDKVLITGGWDGSSALSSVDFYDPSAKTFASLGNMTEARFWHTATSLFNGKILITGGGSSVASAILFDPLTNDFSSAGNMNHARISHRATILRDGRVLITGNQHDFQNTAEIYDPVEGTFTQIANMNDNRNTHTSTLLPNGKVLITGGLQTYDSTSVLSTAELYDPDTGTFTPLGNMAGGVRWDHQATLLDNGTVLITGGGDANVGKKAAEIYDPTPAPSYPNGQFIPISDMLYAHKGHQAALLRDGTVLIIGGNSFNPGNEIYDPLTSTFRATGPMSDSRSDSAAAILPDGRVLFTGGYTTELNITNTAEVWNPLAPFPTHVISGTITRNSAGVGGVLLEGLPGHPLTNYGGYYEGLVINGWSGTVTPTLAAYNFNPATITYSNVTADQANQDYTTTAGPPIIYTVAGNGTQGYSGDGGPATLAQLGYPERVAMDNDGNLFITDMANFRIRKVDHISHLITTVAGNGTCTGSIDGEGGDSADDLRDGYPATSASLRYPNGIAVDGAGNIFIADMNNRRIRKVDTSGIITTVAGTGPPDGYSGDGGPATAAKFFTPSGVTVDSIGNLFISDYGNNVIRKVNTSGIITTVAGNGTQTGSIDGEGGNLADDLGDGGPATSATLHHATNVAVDETGNLFISDLFNNRIRKVNTSGIITTVAGTGIDGYSGDGDPATSAKISQPKQIALDAAGNLFITDYYSQRIRKVDTSGIITTVAGNGTLGEGGDGGPATSASLRYPNALAVDHSGNLFIGDDSMRIRKVGNY